MELAVFGVCRPWHSPRAWWLNSDSGGCAQTIHCCYLPVLQLRPNFPFIYSLCAGIVDKSCLVRLFCLRLFLLDLRPKSRFGTLGVLSFPLLFVLGWSSHIGTLHPGCQACYSVRLPALQLLYILTASRTMEIIPPSSLAAQPRYKVASQSSLARCQCMGAMPFLCMYAFCFLPLPFPPGSELVRRWEGCIRVARSSWCAFLCWPVHFFRRQKPCGRLHQCWCGSYVPIAGRLCSPLMMLSR